MLIALLTATLAHAGCGATSGSSSQFDSADLVFAGRVTSLERQGQQVQVQFETTAWWKGQGSETVGITASIYDVGPVEVAPGQFIAGGVSVEVGQQWVVFARGAENWVSFGGCAGTGHRGLAALAAHLGEPLQVYGELVWDPDPVPPDFGGQVVSEDDTIRLAAVAQERANPHLRLSNVDARVSDGANLDLVTLVSLAKRPDAYSLPVLLSIDFAPEVAEHLIQYAQDEQLIAHLRARGATGDFLRPVVP